MNLHMFSRSLFLVLFLLTSFRLQAVAQHANVAPPMDAADIGLSLALGRELEVANSSAQQKPTSAPTSPPEILRSFHSYYLQIETIFLEPPVIEAEFDRQPAFRLWNLVRKQDPQSADVIIIFTLPALTWQWNYRIIHRASGQLLGSGRVVALEEYEASTLLAGDIATTIQIARGIPASPAKQTGTSAAVAGTSLWHVKGANGNLEGKELTLSISPTMLSISGPNFMGFDIPRQNLLYAYHMKIESGERNRQAAQWEKDWDEACAQTWSGDTCLAALGFPFYLIGEVLLRVGTEGPSHYVVLRLQDGQSLNELAFLTTAEQWPVILAELQATPSKEAAPATEAVKLQKEFETAKKHGVQVYLPSRVEVGRWPTLESGDYLLVINEHDPGRADVFFYKLPTVDFTRPCGVAAVAVSRITPSITGSKVSFLEKGNLRFLDEIRVAELLLRFD